MIVHNTNLQKNVLFYHKFQQKVGLTLFDFQIYDVITTTTKSKTQTTDSVQSLLEKLRV